METFRSRRDPVKTEGIPKDADTGNDAAPTSSEEAVLEELHEATLHHARDGSISHETLEKLHADIERCECSTLFNRYSKGIIPSLDRMFGNIRPILDAIQGEISLAKNPIDAASLKRIADLVAGREQTVRAAISTYVRSIMRFQNLRRLSADGARDVTKQFVDADHARRRAHNNLIDALSIYAQQVQSLIDEGFGDADEAGFVRWTLNADASIIPKGKTVIFDASVMKNRNFIRDWAIVADFDEQLKRLERVEEKK